MAAQDGCTGDCGQAGYENGGNPGVEYTRAKGSYFKKHVLHFDFSISCPHGDLANYSLRHFCLECRDRWTYNWEVVSVP